jgi:predicted DNA-binding transcriptional regulator AlpA
MSQSTNQHNVLTTSQVCSRYGWSETTLWRRQRTNDYGIPFPLADFDGRPNKWLESTLLAWEEENRSQKRQMQNQLIKTTAA